MSFPRNEAETISLFRVIQNRIGWRIVEAQSNAFPDAVLESDDGEKLTCEFEYLSKNFKKHGHLVDDGCDLIICWQDDWPESPLPVMALEDCAGEEMLILQEILTGFVAKEDLSLSQQEHRRIFGENNRLVKKLREAHEEIDFLEKQTLYGVVWQILCMLVSAMFIYHIWKH